MTVLAKRKFKQHATRIPFQRQLLDDNDETPINLSTGVDRVVFKMNWAYQDPELPEVVGRGARFATAPKVENDAVVVTPNLGLVRYDWRAQDVDEWGLFLVEWHVLYTDGSVDIFPREGYDEVRILEEVEPE